MVGVDPAKLLDRMRNECGRLTRAEGSNEGPFPPVLAACTASTRNPKTLHRALAAEGQAIADYTARIGQAEQLGEIGLKVALENQVADETRHNEIERIITGWDDR